MKNNIHSQTGQGLLEAVFAIGILLMVAGAILALATSNLVGQKASEFQVRANNLAREGIEVVRSIRDGNWLAGSDWDEGINSGPSARAMFNEADSSWVLDFEPLTAETVLWLNLATGVHSHDNAGRRTVFRRILELSSICLDSNGAESIVASCPMGDEKIGIEVTSIISWNERNQPKEISLVALLYAWR